jgi:hypothetical protein
MVQLQMGQILQHITCILHIKISLLLKDNGGAYLKDKLQVDKGLSNFLDLGISPRVNSRHWYKL